MTTDDNLRKAAKRWLRSLRAGDVEARARLSRAYPAAPEAPTLRDVQHALARERGFESWIALTRAAAEGSASETPITSLLLAAGKGDPARVAAILDEQFDDRQVAPFGGEVERKRVVALVADVWIRASLEQRPDDRLVS